MQCSPAVRCMTVRSSALQCPAVQYSLSKCIPDGKESGGGAELLDPWQQGSLQGLPVEQPWARQLELAVVIGSHITAMITATCWASFSPLTVLNMLNSYTITDSPLSSPVSVQQNTIYCKSQTTVL